MPADAPPADAPPADIMSADAHGDPVRDSDLDALFRPLTRFSRVGLAVSGGADSSALMLLFSRWAPLAGAGAPDAVVLTVDHGLRAEAAAEAADVAARAARFGLSHETLSHCGARPHSNVQAEARAIRRHLLIDAARRHGLGAIVFAHHEDDQAETFLLRLGRGSGVSGLAAMTLRRDGDGVAFLRPFLAVPRARLIATLRAAGEDWIEDPSNEDCAYARVRMRRLMPALADEGMTAHRLADTARRMARASGALEGMVDGLFAGAFVHRAGFAGVPLCALFQHHEEIRLRALKRLVLFAGGGIYPPREEALEAALCAVGDAARSGDRLRRTLGGATLDVDRSHLWAFREAGRSGLPQVILAARGSREAIVWDGRFRVRPRPACGGPLTLRALGGEGRRQLGDRAEGSWPRGAVETAPSLWRGDALIVAAGFGADGGEAGELPPADFEPLVSLAPRSSMPNPPNLS